MNFLNRIKFPALAGILLLVAFVSCEEDLTTIGSGVVGVDPFTTGTEEFEVFAFNKKVEAVQTNQLPLYQLGVFDDAVYGRTEASITAQVQLITPNPTFGTFTQDSENGSDVIDENETIDSVVVYLPYQLDITDSDGDGVPDGLEVGNELDATNDSDNDGVANNVETANGTNPQNPDTDGDGILDDEDETNDTTTFAERFELDSIYGNINQEFTFKVERSTFFLRDLDPNSSFQESQEYFSNQVFSPEFTDEVFFEGQSVISDTDFLIAGEEDDLDTEDVDESTLVNVAPGIRVRLDEIGISYFQENILDNEGSTELLTAANFTNFFRGVHLSVTPSDSELLFLLNLSAARIEVYYSFDAEQDDEIVREQSSFNLSFLTATNAVNTFLNEDYPDEITSALDNGENASRIYLKGGSGSYAEINLFDPVNGRTVINEIKARNLVINEANLVFFVDRNTLDLAGGIIEPPRLYLYNAETNQPLFDFSIDQLDQTNSLASYPLYDGLLQVNSEDQGIQYRVAITNHINNLIVRDSTNATLGLVITPDIRSTGALNAIFAEIDDATGTNLEMDFPAISTISPLGTVLFGPEEVPGSEDMKLKLEISFTEAN